MKRIIMTLLVSGAALGAGSMAYAGETGGVAVELKAGTLGPGVELNYAISPKFTVGLGLNKYSASTTDTADNIDYDVDLNLQSIALLGSFHPFEGTFRITAGVMSNGNQLKMTATPTADTQIGDLTYTPSEIGTLKGTVDFNSMAPYLGLGWGKSAESGFGMTLDVGVMFQGAPSVSFSANGSQSSNSAFQSELKKEETNAENDLKSFTMYPVVSLGLNYRF